MISNTGRRIRPFSKRTLVTTVQLYSVAAIAATSAPMYAIFPKDDPLNRALPYIVVALSLAYPAMLALAYAHQKSSEKPLRALAETHIPMGLASLLLAVRTMYPLSVIERMWTEKFSLLTVWIGMQ